MPCTCAGREPDCTSGCGADRRAGGRFVPPWADAAYDPVVPDAARGSDGPPPRDRCFPPGPVPPASAQPFGCGTIRK